MEHWQRAGRQTRIALIISAVILLLPTAAGVIGLVHEIMVWDSGRPFKFVQIFGPLIPAMLLLFLLGYAKWLKYKTMNLQATFQARPPLTPGKSARCRLCGAPLPNTGVIRRCSYCDADNLIPEKWYRVYEEDLLKTIMAVEKGIERQLKDRIRTCYRLFSPLGQAILPIFIFLLTGIFYASGGFPEAIISLIGMSCVTAVSLVIANKVYKRQCKEFGLLPDEETPSGDAR